MNAETKFHDDCCDCGCEEHHHHDHDCDCDDCCDCEDIVELTGDDGRTLKFHYVGEIEYKGELYAAFEPAEEIEGFEEDGIVILKVVPGDGDEEELLPIEDEALLEDVYQEFCRALEEDEMADEAETLE